MDRLSSFVRRFSFLALLRDRRILWAWVVVFLLFCYVVGVYLRLAPVRRSGVFLTGDDPLIHYRNTLSVIRTGDMIRNDSLAWQPRGMDWKKIMPNFHYYLGAGVYRFVKALGFQIPHPDSAHGVLSDEIDVYAFCVFFPAFFAPLIVFPMFFLGRVLWDWRAGAIASLFVVSIPGYMSRTTAGFYRHEQIALPLMISALLFFFLAVRQRRLGRCLVFSVVSGIFFFVFAGTWAGFKFIEAAFPVAMVLVILLRRVDFSFVVSYCVVVGVGVSAHLFWYNLIIAGFGIEFALPFASVVVLLAYWFWFRSYSYWTSIVYCGVAAVVILGAMYAVGFADLPLGRLRMFLDPSIQPTPGSPEFTVREHSENSWGWADPGSKVGGAKGSYGYLRWAVFLVFVPLLWHRRVSDVFFVTMCGFAVYFFLRMVRLDILLSPFVVLSTGICVSSVISMLEHRTWVRIGSMLGSVTGVRYEPRKKSRKELRREKRRRKRRERVVKAESPVSGGEKEYWGFVRFVKVVLLLFVLFNGFQSYRSGKVFAGSNLLGIGDDWWDATAWLANNTASSDVIMSWWDYGYWIQVYSHRPTLADGATVRDLAPLAHAFIDGEVTASRFCVSNNVSYVVVDLSADVVWGKWTAMSFIASVSPSDLASFTSDGRIDSLKVRGADATIMRLASLSGVFSQSIVMANFTEVYRSAPYGQVAVYRFWG